MHNIHYSTNIYFPESISDF
uniref:Uncharacterized protein n=1 Tax=Rhizophora mucronata TaxID=61149 RepID=A0A2P2MXG5_RHIMU